jgi:hypothetical protein
MRVLGPGRCVPYTLTAGRAATVGHSLMRWHTEVDRTTCQKVYVNPFPLKNPKRGLRGTVARDPKRRGTGRLWQYQSSLLDLGSFFKVQKPLRLSCAILPVASSCNSILPPCMYSNLGRIMRQRQLDSGSLTAARG